MKKLKIFLITLIGVMILGIFLYSQNKWISVEQITVQSTRIPQNFDEFKIIHLSDLHRQYFGKNQSDLLKKINTFKPDLIAITGDLFDSSYDDEASFSLIEQLSDYPVYFVTGNHEAWKNDFEALENLLTQVGVHVLHNKQETLEIDDPDFVSSVDNNLRVALQESESNKFKLLLSHRPEVFETYVESNIDLVLSGHAHGGQFRLPFIGGLVAPNQGLFPEFSEGTHTKNQTTMIISRGLGNSIIPQRLFNRPHLIEITLKTGA